MKKLISIVLVVLSLVTVLSAIPMTASASSAYQTYTYSIDGDALYSPDAYSATNYLTYTAMGMTTDFNNPGDMVTDGNNKVYIADSGNNRIVILSRYYEYLFEISTFINAQGNSDSLSNPQGVFVVDDEDAPNGGYIWVCDTDKNRLVKFDKAGNFLTIVEQPESQLFDEDAIYKPVAMAIDQYGRMFVVSSTTYQGIIVMNADGEFVGFIGAQAVTISAWEILWRKLQTDEQRKLSASYISTEYNNITINEDGFVYVTTSSITESSVKSAIKSKAKVGTYMPVKLLNPAGTEIMNRNGFWPPAGEISAIKAGLSSKYTGVSTVTDVAVGPQKTWTIIDAKRNKIFTYDFDGNLLFAFGDNGSMLGSIQGIEAVCYQDTKMLVLDRSAKAIIVYDRTEYGDLLIEAIAAENDLDYTTAISCWEKVLQRNTNFDAAYVGIGNALYRGGQYEESLKYYETAYDTDNWSSSYKMVRKEWMSKWFILVLVVIVGIAVGVVKFFGFAGKYNKAVSVNGRAKKTFVEEIMFVFHVMFHPFDGFYDLKHEKRGSVRGALVFLGLTILAFFYQTIGQGYVLNTRGATTTIWKSAISVIIPLMLFVLGNWCLTTLMEGEGSFKDIFIASCYSLMPLPLLIIPATICSNWVTTDEATLITLVTTIAYIWVGILLVFGTQVTHDYSMFKNIVTVIGTLVAMICIIFIVLLFSMLLSKLVSLGTNIVTEIQYRL